MDFNQIIRNSRWRRFFVHRYVSVLALRGRRSFHVASPGWIHKAAVAAVRETCCAAVGELSQRSRLLIGSEASDANAAPHFLSKSPLVSAAGGKLPGDELPGIKHF